MILTLSSPTGTHHIEINADQFARLRHPDVTTEEIHTIASACGINPVFLSEYVKDLKKSVKEALEIDGSCDYSDHL
jgi:hypothetical protein